MCVEGNLLLLSFCFTSMCDWIEKSCTTFSTNQKYKHQETNHNLLTHVFPHLCRLHLFALSSDWFPVVLASVVTVRVITFDLIQVTQLKTVLLINPILFTDEHFLSFWYSALINLPKM